MSPLVVTIFCLHLTYTLHVEGTPSNNRHLLIFDPIPLQETGPKVDTNHEKPQEKQLTLNINSQSNNKKLEEKPIEQAVVNNEKSTSEAPHNDTKLLEHKTFTKPTEMESGALLRGVSVVVVLTALVIVYMALKTYCGKRNKNSAVINKYGVRTRRSDMEMTPLPLDEDEEDETLFEVGNTNR